jgi:hypothetical protein
VEPAKGSLPPYKEIDSANDDEAFVLRLPTFPGLHPRGLVGRRHRVAEGDDNPGEGLDGKGAGGVAARRGFPRQPLRAAARAAPPVVQAAARQAPPRRRRRRLAPPADAAPQPRRRGDRPALRRVQAARAERAQQAAQLIGPRTREAVSFSC